MAMSKAALRRLGRCNDTRPRPWYDIVRFGPLGHTSQGGARTYKAGFGWPHRRCGTEASPLGMGSHRRPNAPSKRNLSSSSARHNDAYEAEKWEKITYLGIATCTILAIYNLSKGHPHHYEEPPPYPYLRIRNKDFPWGPDSLFERKHKNH